MKTVSILDVEILPDRCQGNTTRQFNYAVDHIYRGNLVEVLDHYYEGAHRKANSHLQNRIISHFVELGFETEIQGDFISIKDKDTIIKLSKELESSLEKLKEFRGTSAVADTFIEKMEDALTEALKEIAWKYKIRKPKKS